ncbi:hypothetical protein BDV26DRAFT_289292 [Aspergillus bertholletiae]|uniref:Potassium channel domain-containing protein n=1 Tax=Aspergillus bertholletiae TaxID=1226010 RepID=A0A5N7BIN8_9EURO|nr:hypothetical protein BDV26DRAFT_289292 [Aspergillus bertholletiae]
MSKRKKSIRRASRNALGPFDPLKSVPGRWWRVAAPFPALAVIAILITVCCRHLTIVQGTLCAAAIMFNICTVSDGWHEIENVDGSISILPQPTWMIALKALSLALAGISYIVLVLTMMSKRNPRNGFIVTALGWLTAGVLLFSLIGVTIRRHPMVRQQQSLHYTQNYFYGILAASMYIFVAILLAVYAATLFSVSLSSHDRQIVEHTSIILRTTTFMTVLIGGAGMYSAIEGWSFMDALYFTDYTVLTIGIGNLVPTTHLGRSLLLPYATVGIITLGLVISSIQSCGKSIRQMNLRFELQEARNELLKQKASAEPIPHEYNNSIALSRIPSTATFPQTSDVVKLHRVRADFNRRVRWKTLIFFGVAWFFLWLLSAAIFAKSESSQNWTYFIALYFTYTSLTTIGYGDFYPVSNFGKVFFVFWSLLAIPVLTNLVTAMGEIGLRTLAYFAGYILRMERLKCRGWRMKDGSDPHPTGHCRDIEKHSQWAKPRISSNDLSTIGTASTLVADERELSHSRNKARNHRLLLAEEIKKLVHVLMDESNSQDPRRDWPWVLYLIHSRDGEASSSLEHNFPETMNQARLYASGGLISEERATTEKHNDTLFMLRLLAEKLSSDLRKEATTEHQGINI